MSWHFLQEREAESWAGTCLDGAPAALLRLMPTPAESCSPGSATDCCPSFRYGTTFAPSTEGHGPDTSMLSAEDSPVPTSAAPAGELASTATHPDSGEKWRASLGKYDPTSRSWKTHQTLLFEDSTACLATLPIWGLMRDGELWELPTPDFPTSESEHGSWPTPKARDYKSGGTDPAKVQARIDRRRNQGVIDLPDAAVHRLWKPGFSGLLNPSFSETLMAWPIGWTACEPLETAKFQQWQRLHGAFLEAPHD
jgi:hypothetical protein